MQVWHSPLRDWVTFTRGRNNYTQARNGSRAGARQLASSCCGGSGRGLSDLSALATSPNTDNRAENKPNAEEPQEKS